MRNHLLRSSSYDEKEYGIPINQEDMCVTLLAFQFNVLSTIEQFGVHLTQQEKEDFTHLWRYIGKSLFK